MGIGGADRAVGHDLALDQLDAFQVVADREPLDVADVEAFVGRVLMRWRLADATQWDRRRFSFREG